MYGEGLCSDGRDSWDVEVFVVGDPRELHVDFCTSPSFSWGFEVTIVDLGDFVETTLAIDEECCISTSGQYRLLE